MDGAEIEVALFGCFWVVAGGAVEWGEQLIWDRVDFKWNALAQCHCGDRYAHPAGGDGQAAMAGVDTSIVKARIGYGRVI